MLLRSILGVFASSFALTALNKIMFSVLEIPFPLLITFFHTFLISIFSRVFWKEYPSVSWRVYVSTVIPIAIFTNLDIGLTNMAYSKVTLPVITVVKSVNLVSTYLIAVAMGVERFNCKLLSVCVLIVTAVATAIPSGQVHSGEGLIYLGVAVLSMSMRWVLIQKLSQTLEPMGLFHLTVPISSLGFFVFSMFLEKDEILQWFSREHISTTSMETVFWKPSGVILLSCVCAFSLIFFEFLTVKLASSLTLILSGACKELAILVLAAVGFGERLSLQQWTSILISLVGISFYWRMRHAKSSTVEYSVVQVAVTETAQVIRK